MRKSLYFAVLGLILMVAGTVTTFVAFGQSEADDAAPEVTEDVSALPTSTPVIESVVEESAAVENAQPVAPPTTEPTPIPAATVEPPTAIPTEVPVEPTAETAPVENAVEEVPVEPTAETAPVENAVEEVPVEPTVDTAPAENVEVEAPVEPTADTAPAENVEAEAPVEEATLVPTDVSVAETGADDSEPTPVTEVVEPVIEPTVAVEPAVEPTAATVVPAEGKPQPSDMNANAPQGQGFSAPAAIDPPGTTPLPPHQEEPLLEPTAVTEEQPAIVEGAATPENALPVEPVEMAEGEIEPTLAPTIAAEVAVDAEALEAVVSFSLVSGQVNKPNHRGEINLLLTLPDGTTLETITDAGGNFAFETLLPGDYNLIASAPGFLAKTLNFTLVEGEALTLPVTALNAGDLNQDNQIDLSDVVLIAANYNGPAVVAEADLNGDEWIDISDLTIIGARFGLSGPVAWE